MPLFRCLYYFGLLTVMSCGTALHSQKETETIAVWLFDEHTGLYPSSVLHDVGPDEMIMILGRGGRIVSGKYGNALGVIDPEPIDLPKGDFPYRFGLNPSEMPSGRTVEPMTWHNAFFAALMTSGENHLRKQAGFVQPTVTGLNLGNFNWTIEFWLKLEGFLSGDRVIFELGTGPRAENEKNTRLTMNAVESVFVFNNHGSNSEIRIPTGDDIQVGEWNHYAFVYEASAEQIRHYLNGQVQQLPEKSLILPLEEGDEDYFTIGYTGRWTDPLYGAIDELRFSRGMVYSGSFVPPGSFHGKYLTTPANYEFKEGLPLLFSKSESDCTALDIGSRKHLFIDDAIVAYQDNITFRVNPPRVDRQVIHVDGPFRKHLTVLEDLEGKIRLYTALADDYLGVFLSDDGVHFKAVDTGIEHKGHPNIVIPEPVGVGTIFVDPNAPPKTRYKYISDYHRRGLYVYSSADGFRFERHKQAVAPFRSGSQNDIFFDDQRQLYVGYHRSDYARTPAGYTLREFVMTEAENLLDPWLFDPTTDEDIENAGKVLHEVTPWYLDNGPLTPGGWGIEYPTIFTWNPDIDPVTAGMYNPKAIKYPWAPDTYIAFPIWYFHYYEGEPGRMFLRTRRGGGPTETQFASSRDGIVWKRYPRPVYSGIGRYDGLDVVQTFIAQGMILRGDELWQYVFLDNDYHTAIERTRERRVYRLIQRRDGFVSADSPYGQYGEIITRPLRFSGNRLVLNIDTDAHGYATIAILDVDHNPIPGFNHEQSVYINGDHMEIDAEWLKKGKNLGGLAGQVVRLHFKMKGSRLYSFQFLE